MQFVNIRELSRSTSKYVKIANEEDEVIVTRNGHPYALLQKINDQELEDFIIAKHLNLSNDFNLAKTEFKKDETTNVHTLLDELNNE